MGLDLSDKLVIAVASSAIFDLSESDQVFRQKGIEEYRSYQMQREDQPFEPGAALPFIRRLLSFNSPQENYHPVEVILLSRNDTDAGLRVMNSLEHHNISISRAAFLSGDSPVDYMEAYKTDLFLTEHEPDVLEAIKQSKPAGLIMHGTFEDLESDGELRVAFDFDGILAGDSAEKVYKGNTLDAFHTHEQEHADEPLEPGPLKEVFEHIARIQRDEFDKNKSNPNYKPRLKTAIVTARNAPAHKRAINTMRAWGISVDKTFFMGGVDKAGVLKIFKPHIYFDDQASHLEGIIDDLPAVHVPYGIANQ